MISALNSKTSKQNHILVVNSYPSDLHLSWSLEFVADTINTNSKAMVHFVDLSMSSYSNELSFKSEIKNRLLRFPKNRKVHGCLKIITKKNQLLIHKTKFRFSLSIFLKSVKYFLNIYRYKNLYEMINNGNVNLLMNSLHSSMANKYKTVFYSIRAHPLATILRVYSFLISQKITRCIIGKNKLITNVYVGNGRFPNSAGVIAACQEIGVKVSFLERGGVPGTFEVFTISPHSIKERRREADRIWDLFDENLVNLREKIAISYFDSRRFYDVYAGFNWSNQHKKNIVLEIKSNYPGKKICAFFSSTELEIPVIKDLENSNYFKNQAEALEALLKQLDPSEWIILLRRHPYHKNFRRDPERLLWERCIQYSNLIVLDPDSLVDSYSLLKESDLVCHFNSSIGPESIYYGARHTITFGNTFWDLEEIPFTVRNNEQLLKTIKFVENEIKANSSTSHNRYDAAMKWALYMSVSGKPFKIVEWFKGRANFKTLENSRNLLDKKT